MTTLRLRLIAIPLIFPVLLFGGQALAMPHTVSVAVPQDFLTINSSSRRFFEAGIEKFEAEIERLIQGEFAFSEDLLIVGEDVGIEEDWERPERPNGSLDEIDRIDWRPL